MNRFIFSSTPFHQLYVVESKPIKDTRGYFERYFCAKDFEEIGLTKPITQINHSYTIGKGSIRGLHYQTPPFAETKIIRCLKGAIYDVAVDIRKDSPTFLQYFGIELSETNNQYLYIPEGFAHGFQSLTESSEILYLVSEAFNPSADSGLNPLDPYINIKWPLPIGEISEKDKNAQPLTPTFKGIL